MTALSRPQPRADVSWVVLPSHVPGITSRVVHSLRRHYHRLGEAADDLAREQALAGVSLEDRFSTFVVRSDIQIGIAACDAWLDANARSVAADDGIGCRGRAPAAMAHGCAALDSPAVGPALVEPPRASGVTPGGPLFVRPSGQTLPGAATPGDTQAAQEAASQ